MTTKIDVKSRYYLFCDVCGNRKYSETVSSTNMCSDTICSECGSIMTVKVKQYCIHCKYTWYSASRRIHITCPNCRLQIKNSLLVLK